VFGPDTHNIETGANALKVFFGFAALFTGVSFLIMYSWPGKIAEPRTYPYDGLKKALGPAQQALPDPPKLEVVE
jgi:hypothetical protein